MSLMMVLGFLVIFLLSTCHCQMLYNFLSTSYPVQEGGQVVVTIQRSAADTTPRTLVVLLQNNSADVIGSSQVAVFQPANLTALVTFAAVDDVLPEPEEWITMLLTSTDPEVSVGSQGSAFLVIAASDNAAGVFSFEHSGNFYISEGETIFLNITRTAGAFYDVDLDLRVSNGSGDIELPNNGSVYFAAGERSVAVNMTAYDDATPENEEVFVISLSTTHRHASVSQANRQIVVASSDAPVRFSQAAYYATERDIQSEMALEVLRGHVTVDGEIIGPVDVALLVEYVVIASPRHANDFILENGTLEFQAGELRKDITALISPDDLPELAEQFKVVLVYTGTNSVLVHPSTATVTISANDDQHGVVFFHSNNDNPAYIDEDQSVLHTTLIVSRTGGTYGQILVEFSILGDESALSEISPVSGNISFVEGQSSAAIDISAVPDTKPEISSLYQLVLTSVSGGGRLGEHVSTDIIIQDSDVAHGSVQWRSGAHSIHSEVSPRYVRWTVERNGGHHGDVAVTFLCSYSFNGVVILDTLTFNSSYQVVLRDGNATASVVVEINDSAFLSIGGVFQAVIDEAKLLTETNPPSFNSPYKGDVRSDQVLVDTSHANGMIGFQQLAVIQAFEPEAGINRVSIPLYREGTSGTATVFWEILAAANGSSAEAQDVVSVSGEAVLLAGSSSGNVEVEIIADELSETEESFIVNLTGVQPSDTQRLKNNMTQVTVTILENDNPGGTFNIQGDVSIPIVTEEGDSFALNIERSDGALLSRSVLYSMSTGAAEEFFGATGLLTFAAGERVKTIQLVTVDDDIPELNETFTFSIRSHGDPPSVLGWQTSVLIVVSESDSPYGQFHFQLNSSYSLYESREGNVSTVLVPVMRSAGAFHSVTITWQLDPSAAADLSQTSDVIEFQPGQNLAFIELTSLPDQVPEKTEHFTLKLTSASSSAEIVTPNATTVSVIFNDAAVFFRSLSAIEISEGQVAQLVVVRTETSKPASVRYRTVNGTASADDYQQVVGEVQFSQEQSTAIIELLTVDDVIPEQKEYFYVDLFEPEGDLVMYNVTRAVVFIQANDDPSGVFGFADPFYIDATEGDNIQLKVSRAKGWFGEVVLLWVLKANGVPLESSGEFGSVAGYVQFVQGVTQNSILLEVIADGVPEYDEIYTIELFNATGDLPEYPLIPLNHSSVNITILANDDPNGVLLFDADSIELSVAEDVNEADVNGTEVQFNLRRAKGLFGDIKVLWEVYSSQVAGIIPHQLDLLFASQLGQQVQLVESAGANTPSQRVYRFTGEPASYSSINFVDPFSSSFAISFWMVPQSDCDGYVLVKASAMSLTYYSLRVKASSDGSLISLRLSLTDSRMNVKEVQLAPAQLQPALAPASLWQHVLVNLQADRADFIINGVLAAQEVIPATRQDGRGAVFIGTAPSLGEKYTGLLADLRLYSRKLSPREIDEVFHKPSQLDLDPVSGVVDMSAGQSRASIRLRSVHDVEAENNEVFSIKLISVQGGAKLSTDFSQSKLTVLKSDNANGLFGLDGPCQPTVAVQEGTTISCLVARNRGDAGTVVLSWNITQLFTNVPFDSHSDFTNSSGEVIFSPGQLFGEIKLLALSDGIPELEETFQLVLQAAVSVDGMETTPTSGASINPDASQSLVKIASNDFPNGLLQFINISSPDANREIVMATDQPEVQTDEEVGVLRLLVERAQGLLGVVHVNWKTRDGTAKSSAVASPDYESTQGQLTYGEGQRHAYVNITILEDSVPEDVEYFFVDLLNPRNGAAIGLGATIKIILAPSDDAFGVISFEQASLTHLTTEKQGAASSVLLTVVRGGGLIGPTRVTWHIENDFESDFLESSGVVELGEGVGLVNIALSVRPDVTPELDEVFHVRLVNVSRGRLGETSSLVSTVTILANDDPYGVFIVSHTRTMRVAESTAEVNITISRMGGEEGAVYVWYETADPSSQSPYYPAAVTRATHNDFLPVSNASVAFAAGQVNATFTLLLFEDNVPEPDEYFFVHLLSASLMSGGQERPLANSPRIGSGSSAIAAVVIEANDNANGILKLSNSHIQVEEGVTTPILYVERSAGFYGEVSVRFEVVPGNTTASMDYYYTSNNVILSDQERSKQLPVYINDDVVPELSELFTVRLLPFITGGATLGNATECTVTILESDDPYGVFEFTTLEMTVEEPVEGVNNLDLVISRFGGTMNAVAVLWAATDEQGLAAGEDIQPASGTVFFLASQGSQSIKVNVKADTVPEIAEVVTFNLTLATNGGRIGLSRLLKLNILANDNAHGTVEFVSSRYQVIERESESVENMTIERSGGRFGELRVYYSTSMVNLLSLSAMISRGGADSLWFYGAGVTGQANVSGTVLDKSDQDNPLQACAEFCLLEKSCTSFDINQSSLTCTWYSVQVETISVFQSSSPVRFYSKVAARVDHLYRSQAQKYIDYVPVSSGHVTIADGESSALLPVIILSDTQPEINEIFHMIIEDVELVGEPSPDAANRPTVGVNSSAIITIRSNDDANGIFRIYSSDPRAELDGHRVYVEERAHYSVQLVVERTGGTIGDVSIAWSIDESTSNASRSSDYVADGATLNFANGESMKAITIGIEDDQLPEYSEILIVRLTNPQNGAEIEAGRGSVAVVILPNDYVAGVIGFTTTSYIANEGDSVAVEISRTEPAAGSVTVMWSIVGVNGHQPASNFMNTSGSIFFEHGEKMAVLSLQVLRDDVPEVDEEYQLLLDNVTTRGVHEAGAAIINRQTSTASLTVGASNNPHGVFTFASSSLDLELTEEENTHHLVVDRKFGAIGTVRVHYTIMSGHMTDLVGELEEAVEGEDFTQTTSFIDIANGSKSGHISLEIIDDSIPEVREVFLVNLTGVQLIGQVANENSLPTLAATNTLTQVFIEANDGTRGQIEFPAEYLHLLVNETSAQLQVAVQRIYGTYGPVSVFIYSQTSRNALLHQDYNFTAIELRFLPGESIKFVNVTIFDDDIPEDSESFELVLASPRGGATLGERLAEVTIRENDGSGGEVQFLSNDTVYVQESSSPTNYPTSITIQLSRGPGLFGVIEVEFVVIDSKGNRSADINPSHGTVRFQPLQEVAAIDLNVVDDNLPEFEEILTMKLISQFPSLLGARIEKHILVASSDAPNGLLNLTTKDNETHISVEEGVDALLTFNVHRTGGWSGDVSVVVETVAQSATSSAGRDLYVAPLQFFDLEASSYCAYDRYLLALSAGSGRAQLFIWDGVYRHMTYIESDNAIRCFFYSASNATHVAVINRGLSAVQTVDSHVYVLSDNQPIRRVATVTTQQVIDAALSVLSHGYYLTLITGSERYSAQLHSIHADKVEPAGTAVELSTLASVATHNALVAIGQTADVKVYRVGADGLVLLQTISVEGVTSLDLSAAGDQTLLAVTQPDGLRIYQLINGLFVSLRHSPGVNLQEVTGFQLRDQLMFIVSTSHSSSVLKWSSSDLVRVWEDNSTSHIFPIHGPNATGNELMFASAGSPSGLSLVAMLQQADYIARKVSLEFQEGETLKKLSVPVLDDATAEDVELFRVVLSHPQGGAVLSDDKAVVVNILANDNPHGVVGFAMSSSELRVTEQAADYAVQLMLVREGGTFGRVVVSWQSSVSLDISPNQGTVEFSPGQSVAYLSITVRADNFAENDELVTLTLTGAALTGDSLSGTQATIGGVTSATLLILANDSPYGFVRWDKQTVIIAEPDGPADIIVPLTIVREQGSVGYLQISYITSKDLSLPSDSQATSGLDYISTQGRAIMADNQTVTIVNVSVKADDLPEKEEAFLVNITSVRLVNEGNAEIQPTVRRPGDVITVVIAENDNARGIIQFDVVLNVEGRVDVQEEAGADTLLRLRVTRSGGYFGDQRLLWQILPREASADDLAALSGSAFFAEGQRNATIDIYILDDMQPETIEMFDVQLISVSGGASLGTRRSVRVAILKNDSPRGLFGFTQPFYFIRETSGVVSILVERQHSYQGAVNVYWQLEVNALADFESPHSGSVQFLPDQRVANISLAVKRDDILEGEERYTVSITSADNGADVSLARDSVQVVIEADPGASGVIEVVPEYRTVFVGEPDGVHDGKQMVMLDRGIGMFGEVTATWNILPLVQSSFVSTDGQVVFKDGERWVSVQLQTVDDIVPELQETYQFLVTSATGGASVSADSSQATIRYAASDYPFGLFEFLSSSSITVSENTPQVILTVTRKHGLIGQVQVHYTTSAGSALPGEDYRSSEGSLTFAAGASSFTFSVSILEDQVAERDETFYVNLTHCTLDSSPYPTNFTSVDGLLLDMPPDVGMANVKLITITRNDNAEGMIEFDRHSISVHVRESAGVVSLTVVRNAGTYGLVKVNFTVTSATAIAGEDFILDPGQLSFADGVDVAVINIAITADDLQEMSEFFVVTLTTVSGGAILGAETIAYVTILKSNFPNGKFSFTSPLVRNLMNPASAFELRLSISRSGGLKGNQTLGWQILGPNSLSPLQSTDDLASVDGRGVETTGGVLNWGDGEAGTKHLDILIKAFTGWEVEKVFLVIIERVDNDVSPLDNGEPDPLAGNVTLIISKNGDPNGIMHLSQASLAERSFAEPEIDPYLVQYQIERKEGDLGEQQLAWEVVGNEGDISPMAGNVIIPAGKNLAVVEFFILPDVLPELTERFQLRLLTVIGGATIAPDASDVSFNILFNDDPHGVFEFSEGETSVQVETLTLTRYLNISVNRRAGLLGSVNVVVDLSFSGDSLVFPVSETLSFSHEQPTADLIVDITEEVFLELAHAYTAIIREVIYVDRVQMVSPPRIGEPSSLHIMVSPEAANSFVKFELKSGRANEKDHRAEIRVVRIGSYGNLRVDWMVSDSDPPDGFLLGEVVPARGSLLCAHGEQCASANVTLRATSAPTLYAVKLQEPPILNVAGGARLTGEDLELKIEPHGVVGFATTLVEVEEHQGSVTVPIERMYGSEGSILIAYKVTAGTASARLDFSPPQSTTVTMAEKQLTAELFVSIILDPTAEKDEHFTIQLVSVTLLPPADMRYVSPRISDYTPNATVTIKANGDPYGLLHIVVAPQRVEETQQSQVRVLVRRHAGTYGRVTVRLRSVGGGEAWDSQIPLTAKSQSNNTIREALSNRDSRLAASAGSDYMVLNQEVVFEEGETEQTFTITVMEDDFAEPDEQVFVYLTEPTGGARVASGAADGKKYAYGMFEVTRNDVWNGIIGFADDSLNVTVDEDGDASVTLRLLRVSQAKFTYDTSVQWEAVFSADPSMASNLLESNGIATCPSLLNTCEFEVSVINDITPEFGYTFSVRIFNAGEGTLVEPERAVASVTALPSDYPYGSLDFSQQYVVVDRTASELSVKVKRSGGASHQVSVYYETLALSDSFSRAGRQIHPAVGGEDYTNTSGRLVFEDGVTSSNINLELTPQYVMSFNYPKAFKLTLFDPLYGAVLGPLAESTVLIVNPDETDVWSAQVASSVQELDDYTIGVLLDALLSKDARQLSRNSLTVFEHILDVIIKAVSQRPLHAQLRKKLVDVFCKLMDTEVTASRGRSSLVKYFERSLFTILVGEPCESEFTPYAGITCPHFKFSLVNLLPHKVSNFLFTSSTRNSLQLGDIIVRSSGSNQSCVQLQFVEYNNAHWFSGDTQPLLDDKVLAVNLDIAVGESSSVDYKVFTPDGKRTDKRGQCVYYDEQREAWTSGEDVCTVTNPLDLGTTDMVQCRCNHLSSFAVRTQTRDKRFIGYPNYMFIIAGLTMFGLLVVVLVHTVLPSAGQFMVRLVTHQLACTFALLGVYLLSAFLSPSNSPSPLLVVDGVSNHRCAIVGALLHYFFLLQFVWILLQSINLWLVLIKNDEHTKRLHCYYITFSYGGSAAFIGVFYGVVYSIYRQHSLDPNFIYGDVGNEQEMCFLTNQYAALAGVVAPVAVCTIGVLVFLAEIGYQAKSWKSYDDIFKGRPNGRELPPFICLWFITLIANMAGGLHMAYNYNWMMISFCITLCILLLFTVGYFAVLRGPCCKSSLKLSESKEVVSSINQFRTPSLLVTTDGETLHQMPQIQFPSPSQITANNGLLVSVPRQQPQQWSLDESSDTLESSGLQRTASFGFDPRRQITPLEDDTNDLNDLIQALTDRSPGQMNLSADSTNESLTSSEEHQSYGATQRVSIADTHL